jgi:hypothetical protein
MIAPASRSYPVIGAADAAGVAYDLALAYVTAFQADDGCASERAFKAISERHGGHAAKDVAERLVAAVLDGRVHGGVAR